MTSRIDVCALYPELRDGASPSLYDYTPIIEAIGDVVVRVDQQDYEGDTWALLRRGDDWGYLCFGWGSCSGCDALQAANSAAEVQALADDLEQSVTWRTRAEMLAWFRTHDWEGDYHGRDPDARRFRQEAEAALAGLDAGAPPA